MPRETRQGSATRSHVGTLYGCSSDHPHPWSRSNPMRRLMSVTSSSGLTETWPKRLTLWPVYCDHPFTSAGMWGSQAKHHDLDYPSYLVIGVMFSFVTSSERPCENTCSFCNPSASFLLFGRNCSRQTFGTLSQLKQGKRHNRKRGRKEKTPLLYHGKIHVISLIELDTLPSFPSGSSKTDRQECYKCSSQHSEYQCDPSESGNSGNGERLAGKFPS